MRYINNLRRVFKVYINYWKVGFTLYRDMMNTYPLNTIIVIASALVTLPLMVPHTILYTMGVFICPRKMCLRTIMYIRRLKYMRWIYCGV